MNHKKLLIIVIALLVIIVGYIGYVEYKKFASKNAPSYYLNFAGGYSYRIPDGFVSDDVTVPNAQLISKKGENIQVNNINEVYSKGIVAVQAFDVKLPDEASFKNYINGVYKDSISKSLGGDVAVSFAKKNNFPTATLKITSSGQLIRTQYIYNSNNPVVIVAQDESDAYKEIVNSLNTAQKRTKDFSQIQLDIRANIFMLKSKMFDDAYRLSAKTLKNKLTLEDFKKSFDKTSTTLQTNISILGGILTPKDNKFTTTILFSKPGDKQGDSPQNVLGTIVFEKEGFKWKLTGITLPPDHAFISVSQQ